MATAQQIISSAFRKCKIKKPGVTELNDAFSSLNDMLGSFGAELATNALVRESFALTAADGEYTIGSGGDFDTARPLYIKNVFLKIDNEDYALKIIALSDHNEINYKDRLGIPTGMCYLPEYPLGKLLFSCYPESAYDLYLDSYKPFTQFAALTTTVSLPYEYNEFLVYNLAVRLAEEEAVELSPSVYALADKTMDTVMKINSIATQIPRSKFDFTGTSLTGTEHGGIGEGDIDGGAF